ncbi:GIY-YIG nuclease family protein [Sphingomonas sp.]|uniref:GIY-YIG nuclease family protein n=1 Tax=Sphingomonas sp. TaxID=28214 RepID=UPI002EDA2037
MDPEPRRLGAVKWGVYAFFDYDGEPIYVGQTRESIGTRVRRHLTNQRTDAVAMSVLDPFEVRTIKAWPLREYQLLKASGPNRSPLEEIEAAVAHLNALERTVFEQAIEDSSRNAILNEKDPPPGGFAEWFQPETGELVSPELLAARSHPDTRVARRAMTIARLAQVISERELKTGGLRRALLTQAQRLEMLARKRYEGLGGAASVEKRSKDEPESAGGEEE